MKSYNKKKIKNFINSENDGNKGNPESEVINQKQELVEHIEKIIIVENDGRQLLKD